jgi:hypothetical protein
VDTVGDLVTDVAGGEGRSCRIAQLGLVEPRLQTALAPSESLSYLGIHSKSLSAGGDVALSLHSTPQKSQGISSFSKNFAEIAIRLRLFKG